MLQNMCERWDFYHIFALRKFKFWYSAEISMNKITKVCLSVCKTSLEFVDLCHTYDVCVNYSSISGIKHNVISHFRTVCLNHWLFMWFI